MFGNNKKTLLGFIAAALLASSSPGAWAADGDAVYKGYEGEEFLFNGAGNSGLLRTGLTETVGASFAEKTGTTFSFDAFCCGIARLQTSQQNGDVPWSALSFASMSDYLLAREADLLLPLDPDIIPLDQLVEGGHDGYAIFGYPYASVIAWSSGKWPEGGERPSVIGDIMDVERFPGKRCLYKYPQFGATLEAALLGDGVSAEDLYPIDRTRAFTALNNINDDIVWFETGSQGVQQLLTGACDIALVWNGAISEAIVANDAPYEIAWGNAIWSYVANVIPKGVKNEKAAQAFYRNMIEDRAGQERFADISSYVLLPLKDPVPIADAVQPWVLAGDNAATAIPENHDYYSENIDTLLKDFNSWIVSGRIPQ